MAQCMSLGNLAQLLEQCKIPVPEFRVPSNPSSRASTLRPNSSVDVLGIHQGCGCRICQKLANKFVSPGPCIPWQCHGSKSSPRSG